MSRNATTNGKPPMKRILSCSPFWALTAAHVAQNWGMFCLMSGIPLYLSNVQHYDIATVYKEKMEGCQL